MLEDNSIYHTRLQKLEQLKQLGFSPYPNTIKPTHTSKQILEVYNDKTHEELESITDTVSIAGRVTAIRGFGKAGFIVINDRAGKIQAYVQKNKMDEKEFSAFELLDTGDIVWIQGTPFKTKTGELTIRALKFNILNKTLAELPEKWHGLKDVEIRYRRRYVDLIVNQHVKQTFIARAKIIDAVRDFFKSHEFIEVETPMMHTIAGGASAKPFETYHNALNMPLYLRIAPELYLKRLIVGGMERIFEINRNFRNEGISTKHNPEFTMLEFYQAYATYEDLMKTTEDMFGYLLKRIGMNDEIEFNSRRINLISPFKRVTFYEALTTRTGLSLDGLKDKTIISKYASEHGLKVEQSSDVAGIQLEVFDKLVEDTLIDPTFVTQFPVEVSPLARRNDGKPEIADRFELYISGMEIANAFSELNDPVDQHKRFEQQVVDADEAVKEVDENYIDALRVGLPPTAGEGIGIDRLVMLLTNSSSIRDVILFPLLKKQE